MAEFAFVLFVFVVLLVVGQTTLVLGFVVALRKKSPPLISDQHAPKAVVILCLRGGDPFLPDCLRELLKQDYPNYEVRVILDHPDDPACPIVAEAIEASGASHVTVEILQEKRETCSLKCSSILQIVDSLDDSYEFIAQIDADTIAHPTWLRELATALQDDNVGAATGNRWYMPENPTAGSLVRYNWNAAAVVQMFWYQVAWGGTLAVKTRVFRETDVLERWGKAFCEDTMLFGLLKKVDLKISFVPSLMMINREECDLGGYFYWVRRQLLTARLYHPAWLAVAGHGVATTLVPLAAFVVSIVALVTGNTQAATWAGSALVLYEISIAALLLPMELAMQKIADSRGEPSSWLSLTGKFKCLAAMPLTQVVYPLALASSIFLRRTVWRGITYHIHGSRKIRMEKYVPYQTVQEEKATSL